MNKITFTILGLVICLSSISVNALVEVSYPITCEFVAKAKTLELEGKVDDARVINSFITGVIAERRANRLVQGLSLREGSLIEHIKIVLDDFAEGCKGDNARDFWRSSNHSLSNLQPEPLP